jgi:hypothetical protein
LVASSKESRTYEGASREAQPKALLIPHGSAEGSRLTTTLFGVSKFAVTEPQ